jgi:glycerol-3-phosphate dehydrogenase (NAD(P)+)
MQTITILGAGAWGTAIAQLLATNGHSVLLWAHEQSVTDAINTTHINTLYLPHISLHHSIRATTDLKQALAHSTIIFEAIPVQFLLSVLILAAPHVTSDHQWVVLSKGIEHTTMRMPSAIITQMFGGNTSVAVLAGPSFAHEVATGQITAVTLASAHQKFAHTIQQLVTNDYFYVYISPDVVGVEVGAALKNIIALGVGLLHGAQYGENARAFLITQGLHEMVSLCIALGGIQKTIYGLSGIGDLLLTAQSTHSKNVQIGKRIGAGQSLEAVLATTPYIPEGINTLKSVSALAQKYQINIAICCGIYDVVFTGKPVASLFLNLP